ncbi:MAG: ABC transporter permease [Candidatus Promineifilaceae bacterium]
MKKMLTIGLKDVRLIFRDRGALIMMLLAPYLLTLGLGFVTGAFEEDDGNSGLREIPVQIINSDEGGLSESLVDLFQSDELSSLFLVEESADIETARSMVDENELAAAIIIPAGFSATLLPDPETGEIQTVTPIEIYRSPSRPVSVSVVEAVVTQFINEVDSGSTLATVTIQQLIERGALPTNEGEPLEFAQLPPAIQRIMQPSSDQNAGLATSNLIEIKQTVGATQEQSDFNVLAILVPGMALFFLMYTATLGGRGILMERIGGTLARMQTTPTSAGEILGGKVVGVILTGIAQVSILVIVSTILYGIRWGNGLGVVLLVVSAAVAAAGWGILFASASQNLDQLTAIGTAVMLIFGAVSGTFTPIDSPFLRAIGRITPNQWALEGFTELSLGSSLADILPNVAALWVMALILFAVSTVLFRRNLA